jgi:hypothetical protein
VGAASVIRYRNVEVPRQPGEVGRLRVAQGPDAGLVYVIKSSTAVIGRGDETDVIISDLKASRSHARIDFTLEGWIVNDLGSANGILYQGAYVRKFTLSSGDHFTIGDTIFEFYNSDESTRILTAPIRPALQLVQSDQAIAAQRAKVQGFAQSAQVAAPVVGAPGAKKSNPRTLILLAIGAGIYLYLDQATPPKTANPANSAQKAAMQKEEADKTLSSYLPSTVSKDIEKTAEQYYRQGFREFREENYLRAKAQFELALQVNPNHELSRQYLKNSEKEIDTQVKDMIAGAGRAKTAGRLHEAKGYYETAMRLMYYDRSNPDFIECEEALKKINEELGRGGL